MELSIGSIIKLILGLLVVAAVGYGLYLLFSNNIQGIFGGLNPEEETTKAFLALL